MAADPVVTTWDYTALHTEPSTDEVVRFRREWKGRLGTGLTTASMIVLVIISVVVAFFVIGLGGFLVLATISSVANGSWGAGAPVIAVAVIALVVAVIVRAARRVSRDRWRDLLVQTRFAHANGLLFSARDANPTYPGAIFEIGSERAAHDHFRAAGGRYFDVGNYRYTTGSGKNRSTHRWGFLALHLDRALPHMVLDSTNNNGLFGGTNLPLAFGRDQTLSLEGDFDEHFTLYCPRDYEADALYVLTPDLMAILIDDASSFDVEIIDAWMFVYSAVPFDMTDARTIERLRRIIETVGTTTLNRSARYADERSVPSSGGEASAGPLTARMQTEVIAPGGRRLRRRIPVAAFIIVATVIVGFLLVRVYTGG